jgi:hypothetical protein
MACVPASDQGRLSPPGQHHAGGGDAIGEQGDQQQCTAHRHRDHWRDDRGDAQNKQPQVTTSPRRQPATAVPVIEVDDRAGRRVAHHQVARARGDAPDDGSPAPSSPPGIHRRRCQHRRVGIAVDDGVEVGAERRSQLLEPGDLTVGPVEDARQGDDRPRDHRPVGEETTGGEQRERQPEHRHLVGGDPRPQAQQQRRDDPPGDPSVQQARHEAVFGFGKAGPEVSLRSARVGRGVDIDPVGVADVERSHEAAVGQPSHSSAQRPVPARRAGCQRLEDRRRAQEGTANTTHLTPFYLPRPRRSSRVGQGVIGTPA